MGVLTQQEIAAKLKQLAPRVQTNAKANPLPRQTAPLGVPVVSPQQPVSGGQRGQS